MNPLSISTNFKDFEDTLSPKHAHLPQVPKDNIAETVAHNNNFKQDYRNLIAGTASSVISRTIVAPLDRLKVLYQVNYVGAAKPPSVLSGFKAIYKQDGIKGFFKGNGINLVKGSPEQGIKLYCFELLKWNFQCKYGESLTTGMIFFAGAVGGIISQLCIFPLEVLKIRIAASPPGTYNGINDAINKILKEPRGIFNFYSGIEAALCCVIPNSGLNLTVYEVLKIFFSGKKSIDNAASLSSMTLMFIGGLSALISSTILYPFNMLQARMIIYNLKPGEFKILKPESIMFPSILKYKFITLFYSTLKNDGFFGFYKGSLPGITKIVLGNALGFLVYEKTKNILGVNSHSFKT